MHTVTASSVKNISAQPSLLQNASHIHMCFKNVAVVMCTTMFKAIALHLANAMHLCFLYDS